MREIAYIYMRVVVMIFITIGVVLIEIGLALMRVVCHVRTMRIKGLYLAAYRRFIGCLSVCSFVLICLQSCVSRCPSEWSDQLLTHSLFTFSGRRTFYVAIDDERLDDDQLWYLQPPLAIFKPLYRSITVLSDFGISL